MNIGQKEKKTNSISVSFIKMVQILLIHSNTNKLSDIIYYKKKIKIIKKQSKEKIYEKKIQIKHLRSLLNIDNTAFEQWT